MSFICDICGTNFSFPYNLKQHKKRAKYCMAKAENLQCKYCNKVSTDPDHLVNCVYYKNYKLELELKEIKIKLSDTEDELVELRQKLEKEQKFKDDLLIKTATKPTKNINNNYNLSITVFPPEEEVKRQWEDIICPDVLKGGLKAFARIGHDHFLMNDGQPKIVCIDPSRNKFMYMDSNQIYQYDIRLQKITKRFFAPGADVAREFIKNFTVKDDEDETLFNQAMPVSYISNINSPSHKEFIRHLQHHIQITS